MAGLSGRVRSLERRAGVGAGTACPRCAGRGLPAWALVVDGECVGPPPAGCPSCGRVGELRRTVVELERDAGPPVQGAAP